MRNGEILTAGIGLLQGRGLRISARVPHQSRVARQLPLGGSYVRVLVDINPWRDFRYSPMGIDMCFALDMPCGARGDFYRPSLPKATYRIPKGYIDFAKQKYRAVGISTKCKINLAGAGDHTGPLFIYRTVKTKASFTAKARGEGIYLLPGRRWHGASRDG